MKENLLTVNDLYTRVEEKEILKGLNLEINKGEVHVVMGPNGAGKSTLAYTLMGHPRYKVEKGTISFEGKDITNLKTNERAKKGLFLSFQAPEEVPGITVESFLRAAKSAVTDEQVKAFKFKKELRIMMEELKMKEEYAKRYLNVGFSGGEKKKNEILQMTVLQPKLAILDETDSGLDVDAVRIVASGVNKLRNGENSFVIITHNDKLLEYIQPDIVHVLVDGKIVRTGDYSLAKHINERGYEELLKEL